MVGKTVVVTGAASGLGYALTSQLLASGAKVALMDIDEKGLSARGAELQPYSTRLKLIPADVSNFASFSDAIKSAQAAFGVIDCVINNAGVGGTLPFSDATLKHWHRIIDLNLYGVIHGTTLAFNVMKEQGHGCIVNVASISGLIPFPGQSLYATTKHAVAGFTLSLRPEAKKYGIQMVLVCPGLIKTDIFYKPILGASAPADAALIPKGAMEASVAARIVIQGIRRGKRLIVFPRRYKMLHLLYRLVPSAFYG